MNAQESSFVLEPEHLMTGHAMSAEMRVFDAGATWNCPSDGRLFATLVVGTWTKAKAEDPARSARDFDGIKIYFAYPATARSAADVLREAAKQLDRAARAMQNRILNLAVAERRARRDRFDCLRPEQVVSRMTAKGADHHER